MRAAAPPTTRTANESDRSPEQIEASQKAAGWHTIFSGSSTSVASI